MYGFGDAFWRWDHWELCSSRCKDPSLCELRKRGYYCNCTVRLARSTGRAWSSYPALHLCDYEGGESIGHWGGDDGYHRDMLASQLGWHIAVRGPFTDMWPLLNWGLGPFVCFSWLHSKFLACYHLPWKPLYTQRPFRGHVQNGSVSPE